MSTPRFILILGLASALGAGAFLLIGEEKPDLAYVKIGSALVAAEVADSPEELRQGFSGREFLRPGEGRLFIFEETGRHSIWMKDMKFPIDIVWIRDGRVASLRENVSAPLPDTPDHLLPIYMPDSSADFVLEVNAGFVGQNGVRVGQGVGIYRSDGTVLAARQSDLQSLPGYGYFIETLRRAPFTGKNFRTGDVLAATDAYTQYFITYESDGLLLGGVMNVPVGPAPEGGFPILILNHGLIYPEIYYSGRGSRREKDFFSRNGYVTIHPDYRGYGIDAAHACPPTLSWISEKERCEHDFYAGYTRDIMNLIVALKSAQSTRLSLVDKNYEAKPRSLDIDLSRIGMWGHSMGGGIAARVAVLMPEVRAFVLFASISADAQDNFYELPEPEISRLAEEYGLGAKASEIYDMISPLFYFESVAAPFQLHHGTADGGVPIEFSRKMYGALSALGKPVEFFSYPGEEHEFIEDWQLAAERALKFFDFYVKR